MISGLQLLIIIFALFALSRVILRLKDNEITISEFVFWAFVWSGLILIAFIPNILVEFSQFFGIGRGLDFLTIFGIVFIFYLIFKIFVKIEKLQSDITLLTRSIAIKNAKDKK